MKMFIFALAAVTCSSAFAGEIERQFGVVEAQYVQSLRVQKAKEQEQEREKEKNRLHDFEIKELKSYGLGTDYLQVESNGKAVSEWSYVLTSYVQTPTLQRCRIKTAWISDRHNQLITSKAGDPFTDIESRCFNADGSLLEKRP